MKNKKHKNSRIYAKFQLPDGDEITLSFRSSEQFDKQSDFNRVASKFKLIKKSKDRLDMGLPSKDAFKNLEELFYDKYPQYNV